MIISVIVPSRLSNSRTTGNRKHLLMKVIGRGSLLVVRKIYSIFPIARTTIS